MTTKYSSVDRKRLSEDKIDIESNNFHNPNDDSIREVLDHYLNGKPNPKPTKNQKHYLRYYKKHKNELAQALQ